MQQIKSVALFALAVFVTGCDSDDGIPVTGTLLMDGRPTTGELVFETLGNNASPDDSVTAIADERGRFSAVVPNAEAGEESITCRIVIRVTPLSESGMPSVFDPDAPPEKRVELLRDLDTKGSRLTFALTQ